MDRGNSSSSSHPRHLRGKAIGLFHARRARERRRQWKNEEDITYNFKQRIRDKPRSRHDQSENSDSSNNHDESSASCSSKPGRLRGKEIGLYYRDKNREKWKRPLATITLPPATKHRIRDLLSSPSLRSFIGDGTSYENVKDSSFKREFLKNISGSLDERLFSFSLDTEQDPTLDQIFYDELVTKQETDRVYQDWQKKRQSLPAYKMKDDIIRLIESNQVVVISGETGCGKTTQVPQFILDHYLMKKQGSVCRIVCTQPRRISAIAVAERVANERNESLGLTSGYSIRLERQSPRNRGSIIFCTAGIVLRQLVLDPTMKGISHIILDEIHERDITCDFLICIIKQVIEIRKDLKVILMSATLNAESFSVYYNNAPHINIPGFTYPVDEYYLEDVIERLNFTFENKDNRGSFARRQQAEYGEMIGPFLSELGKSKKYSRNTLAQLADPICEKWNTQLIHDLICDICQKEENKGAILVFVPGFMDISDLIKQMKNSGNFPEYRFIIIPLHSQMPTVNQREIFLPPPPNKRKIVVATNIAETSITIDDVVYVIDGGRIKMSNYYPETNIQTLLPEWVSLANAAQRKGRAGRCQPGKCFHLYSSARRALLEPYQKPEILRTRLEDTILQAKILQVGQIRPFFAKLLDSPEDEAVSRSLELLRRLEAIDENENLKPLGYHLAKLPLQPQIGKMLLFGAMFSCLNPILSVAAALDFKDPFLLPLGKEKLVDKKRRELAEGVKSDHYIVYRALERFENTDRKGAFCNEYFLSFPTMKMLQKLKKDYMSYLHQMEYVSSCNPKDPSCNVNSSNISLIKAIICAGLYPNVIIGRQAKRSIYMKLMNGKPVKGHPKSLFCEPMYLDSPLLVYYVRLKSSRDYVHDCTLVHPLSVIFFGDQFRRETIDQTKVITIGDGINFKCSDENTCKLVGDLRKKLNLFLEYKISHPGVIDWRKRGPDVILLEAIKDMITNEELGDLDLDAFDDFEGEDDDVEDIDRFAKEEVDHCAKKEVDPFAEVLPEGFEEVPDSVDYSESNEEMCELVESD